MSLFDKLFGDSSATLPDEQVAEKVRNSECAQRFAAHFRSLFSLEDEHLRWLMSNSRKKEFQIRVRKDAVYLLWFDFTNKADAQVETECWQFGAHGYADLPNDQYIRALWTFLLEVIGSCPTVTVNKGHIYANEAAKKGW